MHFLRMKKVKYTDNWLMLLGNCRNFAFLKLAAFMKPQKETFMLDHLWTDKAYRTVPSTRPLIFSNTKQSPYVVAMTNGSYHGPPLLRRITNGLRRSVHSTKTSRRNYRIMTP